MSSSTSGSWPAKATTIRNDSDDIDGHFLIKILPKDDDTIELKSWDHCIVAANLDVSSGDLPPFFRDFRSDQAGHLFEYFQPSAKNIYAVDVGDIMTPGFESIRLPKKPKNNGFADIQRKVKHFTLDNLRC